MPRGMKEKNAAASVQDGTLKSRGALRVLICSGSPGWSRMLMLCSFPRKRLLIRTAIACVVFAGASLTPAWSQQLLRGIQASRAPLQFGMSAEQASQALGVPLSYVSGGYGDELLLAIPNVKGSALSSRSDGLYLQFRKGRLAGWKGDWGTVVRSW